MNFKAASLVCVLFLVPGCGKDEDYAQSPAPVGTQAPQPTPPPIEPTAGPTVGPSPTQPPSGTDAFEAVKPIIAGTCAQAGCHNGAAFIATGAAFKASKAKVRLSNKSMPPPGAPQASKFTEADRAALLKYLQ